MVMSSEKHDKTAWLTGLRGIAALIVAFTHFIAGELEVGFRDYASDPAEDNRKFFQLPPFRVIFADQAMVAIFFIVSAYSISIGPLRKRDYASRESFLASLASSVLRRPVRLFAPVVVLESISHVAFYFGLYPWTDLFDDQLDSFWKVFLHFWNYLFHSFWPFAGDYIKIGLNVQIWTIPVEFRGSCLVFFLIFCMFNMRPLIRLSVITMIGMYGVIQADWMMFTFLSGLLIAERQSLAEMQSRERLPEHKGLKVKRGWTDGWLSAGNGCLFVLGFYLLCIPEQPASAPWTLGFLPLFALSPSDLHRYLRISQMWRSIGAALFIFSVDNSSILQKPFNLSGVQYLGRISYGLYLVHVIIYRILRDKLIHLIWWALGSDSAWGWIGAAVLLTPTVFLAAHLFYESVDKRAVELARWLESRMQRSHA